LTDRGLGFLVSPGGVSSNVCLKHQVSEVSVRFSPSAHVYDPSRSVSVRVQSYQHIPVIFHGKDLLLLAWLRAALRVVWRVASDPQTSEPKANRKRSACLPFAPQVSLNIQCGGMVESVQQQRCGL
jgi:hypothetical protein